MNETCQILVYADGGEMIRKNLNIIKRNVEALFLAIQETDLEGKCENTKHRSMLSHEQKTEEPQHEASTNF